MNHASNISTETHQSRTSGWLSFASYVLIVVAFFHLIEGFVAIFKPSLYVASQNQLLVFSYDAWGWTHIVFGVILMAAAASLLAGRMWARVLAIIPATFSAIANFGFIWAYPLWSIMMITLDILVIYAAAMHGNSRTEEYDE